MSNVKNRIFSLFIGSPFLDGGLWSFEGTNQTTSGCLIELRFEALFEEQKRLLPVIIDENSGESESIFRSQFEHD
jgi:hypothetical protein